MEQDGGQPALGLLEHAVIVQRPAAAEICHWYVHRESSILQHFDRGSRHLSVEVIVESISEEQDAAAAITCAGAISPPALERLRREARHTTLGCHARHKLRNGAQAGCL